MPEIKARWPALMSEGDAAEYVGVSLAQFRKEREAGLWPKPAARGCRRNTYSRRQLDKIIDRITSETHDAAAPDSDLDIAQIDVDREFGLDINGHD
jgi:hypothetical protein